MPTQKVTELISIYCPKCGKHFSHQVKLAGRAVGGVAGAIAGAKAGAGVGLVAGPMGAIAGTIPGAVLGFVFGKRVGRSMADDPKCPSCEHKFVAPR